MGEDADKIQAVRETRLRNVQHMVGPEPFGKLQAIIGAIDSNDVASPQHARLHQEAHAQRPTPRTTTVSSKRKASLGKTDICLARSRPTVTAMISVRTAISEGRSSGTRTRKLPGIMYKIGRASCRE